MSNSSFSGEREHDTCSEEEFIDEEYQDPTIDDSTAEEIFKYRQGRKLEEYEPVHGKPTTTTEERIREYIKEAKSYVAVEKRWQKNAKELFEQRAPPALLDNRKKLEQKFNTQSDKADGETWRIKADEESDVKIKEEIRKLQGKIRLIKQENAELETKKAMLERENEAYRCWLT